MHFKISSAICLNFGQSKILSSGNDSNANGHVLPVLLKDDCRFHNVELLKRCKRLLYTTYVSHPEKAGENNGLTGGPSDLGTKILQKYSKIILTLPKTFDFHS